MTTKQHLRLPSHFFWLGKMLAEGSSSVQFLLPQKRSDEIALFLACRHSKCHISSFAWDLKEQPSHSQCLPKLTAYGSFEENWVKTIKAIKGALLSTGFTREKLQDRDNLGMLQTLLGLGEEKAGPGAPYHMPIWQVICTQSLLMLSSRTKIKQAYFLVFSGKRHIQCKEERWFLSPTCPRVDVEQFLQPLASGTAQNSSQFSSAQAEEGEKP